MLSTVSSQRKTVPINTPSFSNRRDIPNHNAFISLANAASTAVNMQDNKMEMNQTFNGTRSKIINARDIIIKEGKISRNPLRSQSTRRGLVAPYQRDIDTGKYV